MVIGPCPQVATQTAQHSSTSSTSGTSSTSSTSSSCSSSSSSSSRAEAQSSGEPVSRSSISLPKPNCPGAKMQPEDGDDESLRRCREKHKDSGRGSNWAASLPAVVLTSPKLLNPKGPKPLFGAWCQNPVEFGFGIRN